MIPKNANTFLLTSTTLLVMALNAHANPREVESKQDVDSADVLPVTIEIPADMLSTDTLHMESAPAINIEDIAVFEMPAEQDLPALEPLGMADSHHDGTASESHAHHAAETELEIELGELEHDRELHDDAWSQEMMPRIELDIPAPAISLDF